MNLIQVEFKEVDDQQQEQTIEVPCYDPVETEKSVSMAGLYLHEGVRSANSVWNPLGPECAYGTILVMRHDADRMAKAERFDLVMKCIGTGVPEEGEDGQENPDQEVRFKNMLLLRTDSVTHVDQSLEEQTGEEINYLVVARIADGRYLAQRFSEPLKMLVNVSGPGWPHNRFVKKSLRKCNPDDPNSPLVPWTWTELVRHLWNKCKELGDPPSELPYELSEPPRNLRFTGINAYQALNCVLDILGLALAWDGSSYSVVRVGAPDSSFTELLDKYSDARKIYDDWTESFFQPDYPKKVRVFFRVRPRHDGSARHYQSDAEATVPSRVHYIDVQIPSQEDKAYDGYAVEWSSQYAILSDDGASFENDSELQTEAQDLAENWYKNRGFELGKGMKKLRMRFSGIPEFKPGSQVVGVGVFQDEQGALVTEVVNHSYYLVSVSGSFWGWSRCEWKCPSDIQYYPEELVRLVQIKERMVKPCFGIGNREVYKAVIVHRQGEQACDWIDESEVYVIHADNLPLNEGERLLAKLSGWYPTDDEGYGGGSGSCYSYGSGVEQGGPAVPLFVVADAGSGTVVVKTLHEIVPGPGCISPYPPSGHPIDRCVSYYYYGVTQRWDSECDEWVDGQCVLIADIGRKRLPLNRRFLARRYPGFPTNIEAVSLPIDSPCSEEQNIMRDTAIYFVDYQPVGVVLRVGEVIGCCPAFDYGSGSGSGSGSGPGSGPGGELRKICEPEIWKVYSASTLQYNQEDCRWDEHSPVAVVEKCGNDIAKLDVVVAYYSDVLPYSLLKSCGGYYGGTGGGDGGGGGGGNLPPGGGSGPGSGYYNQNELCVPLYITECGYTGNRTVVGDVYCSSGKIMVVHLTETWQCGRLIKSVRNSPRRSGCCECSGGSGPGGGDGGGGGGGGGGGDGGGNTTSACCCYGQNPIPEKVLVVFDTSLPCLPNQIELTRVYDCPDPAYIAPWQWNQCEMQIWFQCHGSSGMGYRLGINGAVLATIGQWVQSSCDPFMFIDGIGTAYSYCQACGPPVSNIGASVYAL